MSEAASCQRSAELLRSRERFVAEKIHEACSMYFYMRNLDVDLNDVYAVFDDSSTPKWVDYKVTKKVDVPVKTERPYVRLSLAFTVDRNAPIGESNPLTLIITERSGNYWKKELTLNVTPRPKPKEFALLQNFPNPFNPETWIPYQLKEASDVTIRIFDLSGKIVRTLFLGEKPADFYVTKDSAAYWDGRNDFGERVASGVYFYQLHAGENSAMRKMLILK